MIMFNNSDLITGSAGPIEVTIDRTYIGALKRREYFEVAIELGEHELAIRHKEFFVPKYYQNDYLIEVHSNNSALRVYTGLASTKYEMLDLSPINFEKNFKKQHLI